MGYKDGICQSRFVKSLRIIRFKRHDNERAYGPCAQVWRQGEVDIITFNCGNWELLRINLVQGGCK